MQSVVQSVELYINYATAQSYSCIFSTSSSSNLLCGSHNWSFLLTCLLHVICSVCVCLHEKVRSLRAPKGKNSSNAVKTLSWNETTQNKIGVLWIDLLLPPPPIISNISSLNTHSVILILAGVFFFFTKLRKCKLRLVLSQTSNMTPLLFPVVRNTAYYLIQGIFSRQTSTLLNLLASIQFAGQLKSMFSNSCFEICTEI